MDAKHIIVLLLMLATLVVLVMGVISMMRGGESNRKNGNKLMSLRVGLQGLTVAVLGVLFLFSK
jgi:Hypoxia induced protein conserved region